ncbi:hypothetical protein M011DRAFT_16642 [Sporormia fimetaria CBS 119925]|uniref:Uncharacterized protein n=1 Tax=Sporormia fimetaria CBS 119925 TaxID=1340428 RepID=A0A6A6VR98_9PLEO|nr:hypothetical protein M011DRAFT_16642 [Sporormia fimetaria CBS 119925]
MGCGHLWIQYLAIEHGETLSPRSCASILRQDSDLVLSSPEPYSRLWLPAYSIPIETKVRYKCWGGQGDRGYLALSARLLCIWPRPRARKIAKCASFFPFRDTIHLAKRWLGAADLASYRSGRRQGVLECSTLNDECRVMFCGSSPGNPRLWFLGSGKVRVFRQAAAAGKLTY